MTAPLTDPDKARPSNAFKEVELFDPLISPPVAPRGTAIDRALATIWDPMELAPIYSNSFARVVVALKLAHLCGRELKEVVRCE